MTETRSMADPHLWGLNASDYRLHALENKQTATKHNNAIKDDGVYGPAASGAASEAGQMAASDYEVTFQEPLESYGASTNGKRIDGIRYKFGESEKS